MQKSLVGEEGGVGGDLEAVAQEEERDDFGPWFLLQISFAMLSFFCGEKKKIMRGNEFIKMDG